MLKKKNFERQTFVENRFSSPACGWGPAVHSASYLPSLLHFSPLEPIICQQLAAPTSLTCLRNQIYIFRIFYIIFYRIIVIIVGPPKQLKQPTALPCLRFVFLAFLSSYNIQLLSNVYPPQCQCIVMEHKKAKSIGFLTQLLLLLPLLSIRRFSKFSD